MIHNVYKNRGETPLECLERFRNFISAPKDASMTYLGRLDPLAEGVLLIGTENDTAQKRKEEIMAVDKEYDFLALFGFATDTYDIMGKITHQDSGLEISEMDLIKLCRIYEGEREQKYPKYSSKVISSPSEISPSKKVSIYKLEFKKLYTLSKKELLSRIVIDISRVKGEFRQGEILELWKEKIEQGKSDKYLVAEFSAHVSSGTYIRSIVNDLGTTLGFGATTLYIKRTRAGEHKIEDSLRF